MGACPPPPRSPCDHLTHEPYFTAGPRYMEVTKSPFIPRCNLPYAIDVAGVRVAQAHAEPIAQSHNNQNDTTKIPAPYTNEPWR